ncbi:MAG: YncE family protein [Opitutaceae bacterium]|nr:YncE family protein [Opitutaceae bacterium]
MIKKCSGALASLSLLTLGGVLFSAASAVSAQAAQLPGIAGEQRPTLQLIEKIALPNVVGRIDHMALDAKRKRLFVAACGNDTVEVIDYPLGRVFCTLKGFSFPKGIIYVPDFDRLYVVSAGDGTIRVLDSGYRPIETIRIGFAADFITYSTVTKRLYMTIDENGGGIMVIDAQTNKVLDFIQTNGTPEDLQVDAKGEFLYTNIPDDSDHVNVINLKTKEIKRWAVGARSPIPLALDDASRRLFVVTRKPAQLVVFNIDTGKEVARLATARDSANMAWDKDRKRIYVMGGEGRLDSFQQKGPDSYELLDSIKTEVEMRTGILHQTRGMLYAPVPAHGDSPAELWNFETHNHD